ncbi:hypothetical protein Exig_1285 [Exiguobacterium sibiricum 255-15]|uniref:DUF2268 domain-containing protein n=1 Tax=Exiguobacterium sibiricum (strain DSM 17290 / CCUG 55495 / CIP 109462 / JCM 13490 / 255-15) TaxID=262543 RepID=B1YF82_EXIS2|nr:hypothetical protein Exig_1285 [Exiguobacterium sibiricum 255-15]
MLKKIIVPVLCMLLLLLSACTENKEEAEAHQKPVEIQPETVKIARNSELTIVPLYTPYQKYLKASLKTDDPEMDKKYYAKYVLSYIDEIGEQEKFSTADLKGNFMLQSTSYEQELLNRIDTLMKQHDKIKEVITENYIAAHKILPKKKSTIFIVPSNSDFPTMSESLAGVTGAAYKDAFVLYLDQTFDKNVLAYTIAHEYHHLILHDTPDFKISSVLKSVIVEGKADAFADRIVKGVSPPWDVPMDNTTKKHVAGLVNNYETTFNDVTFGNEQKDIPRWSNYILGRDILNHYLKSNPNLSIKEWTYKDEHEILKDYKYQNILE